VIIPPGIRLDVEPGEVRDREHSACVMCGRRGQHAHHRWFRSQGGPDAWANLIWVCTYCHDMIHHGNRASMELLGVRCSRNGQWPALISVTYHRRQGMVLLDDAGNVNQVEAA